MAEATVKQSAKDFSADQDVQEAAFRVYNDWIADFCSHAPGRLYAIPCLPVYDS